MEWEFVNWCENVCVPVFFFNEQLHCIGIILINALDVALSRLLDDCAAAGLT